MTRLFAIGMITAALGCTEPNPLAMADTSSGTTDASTTTMSTSDPTTTMSTTTMSTSATTTTTTESGSTDTSAETSTPVDTSSGEAVCDPASSRCVPLTPDGWTGPAAIRTTAADGEDPGCAGAYDLAGTVAYADYDLGVHNCDCECDAPKDVECIYPVPMGGDTSSNCASPIASIDVTNACQALPANLQISADEYWTAVSGVDDGSCTPQPTVEIATPTFEDRLTICNAPDAGQLDCAADETCAPLPGAEHDGDICVWRSGDAQCPAEWPTRRFAHEGFTGERSCTACTCGEVTGDCTGSILLFGTTNCTNAPLVNVPIGSDSCEQGAVAATVRGVRINTFPVPVDAECQPSNSVPMGSVDVSGPVTACCLAPD